MSSNACLTTPLTTRASMFSLTALTLPGNVTINVFFAVPATGRERAAMGVCCSDVAINKCTRPEA